MEKVDMRDARVNVEDVRLAEIKMFDTNYGGVVSFFPVRAYTIMVNTEEGWKNFMNPGWELPVFQKSPYMGSNSLGEDTAPFIKRVSGEIQDGPCYVMDFQPITRSIASDYFDRNRPSNGTVITGGELEDFALRTDLFIFDRISLIRDRKLDAYERKAAQDMQQRSQFMQYMSACEKERQYQ